jgi:hypothetical protein
MSEPTFQIDSNQPRTWPLVVALASFGLSSIVSILFLVGAFYATRFQRIAPLENIGSASAYSTSLSVDSDREQFRRQLLPLLEKSATVEAKVLTVLEWVMNQVSIIGYGYSKSSWEMVKLGQQGSGLSCAGMGQVFKDALLSVDIPARLVILKRDMFSYWDTHVSVEAWVEGKWRLYDPTFHIVFEAAGESVGAFTAQNWFINRQGPAVQLRFLGEVKYPARIDQYYLPFDRLLDNIFVATKFRNSHLRDFPFIEHLVLGGIQYPADDRHMRLPYVIYRYIYNIAVFLIPPINLLLLLAVVLLVVRMYRSRRHPEEFPQRQCARANRVD